MSTMGLAVYGAEREQLLLIRSLQDGERNVIGSSSNNNNNRVTGTPKNGVSVINVATSSGGQSDNSRQQNNVLPPYDPSRLKKHGKNGQPPPIAVAKRNLRERNRVKQVNNGFAKLRQHIPSQVAQGYGDRGKKLSKVETLRMAVEYIRGLQRLLAEADGLDYDSALASQSAGCVGSPMTLPSPSGSVYSGSTHNGSGDVLGLAGSELDEQQLEHSTLDDNDPETEAYLVDDEEREDETKERRDIKRFRDDGSQNKLAENQNRRRRNSPGVYYVNRQTTGYGDEENIEPLVNHNNNLNLVANNNNNTLLVTGYSPILLQSNSPTGLQNIKREQHQQHHHHHQMDEEEVGLIVRREDDVIAPSSGGLLLTTSSPYSGEILIENPDTGRLVPVKLEDHEAGQLVYVTTSNNPVTSDGLGAYYKHELADPTTVASSPEQLMDMVSWWEQEQGRFVHQLQGHHHHHHHPHLHQNHQSAGHQPTHQQLASQQHQRLAHV